MLNGADEAVLAAVLGHVTDAEVDDLARGCVGDVATGDHHAARALRSHPHERLDQLSLAVALDPAMPNTSPACTSRSRSATVVTPRSSSTHSWADARAPARPAWPGALSRVKDTSRPDHQRGERLLGGGLRIGRADHLAAAEHDDAGRRPRAPRGACG